MRDRLIELLENSPRLDAMYGEYDVAADWLIANGVTVQEWISVEDRLPKPTEKVLTYRRSLCDEYAKTTIEYMFLYNGEVGWTGDVDTWKTVVTHWMPLPQPPKGE